MSAWKIPFGAFANLDFDLSIGCYYFMIPPMINESTKISLPDVEEFPESLSYKVDVNTSPDPAHTQAESPQLASDHSKICLETLVRLYYLRHGFSGSDALLTNFLVLIAFQSITKLKAGIPPPSSSSSSSDLSIPGITASPFTAQDLSDARSALILAEKGLTEQGQCYFFSQAFFHVVLNSISPEDAQLVQHYTKVPSEGPDERRMRAEHVHSDFPIEIVTVTNGATSQSLDKLTKRSFKPPAILDKMA
uniref:Uncharacterized protein n=1 Tax=Fusarium oxysporum (strain Fo5176) TaxID=660025 RepID=A0A0D2XFK3_FUSOF